MTVNIISGHRPEPEPHEPDGREGLTVFDSDAARAETGLLDRMREGTGSLDLAADPVVLPDFCHKDKSEMPSSIAVATRRAIRPTLTDSALNCGMALGTLDTARPSDPAVGQFYRLVRERFPQPAGWRRDLSKDEVLRAAVEGAEFAADRHGLAESDLHRVEEFGRQSVEEFGGAARARRELPWLCVQLARLRFGSIGPSTHFLELQQVEEVLEPTAAEQLGIAPGQITLQWHNGGGVLTGQIGELYARRRSASKLLRTEMALQKPLTHLLAAGPARSRARYDAFFRSGCPTIPTDTAEGRRLLLAQRLAMNYGFAYRLATYAALREIAREAFGATLALVVDSPHNSVYEETVDGAPALVHRHNASRAFGPDRMVGHPVFATTGQPVLLPGTTRTSSYVCLPGPDAHRSLHSACHGSGSIIDAFVRDGRSGPDPRGHTTDRFRYTDAAPQTVAHFDDHGVDEALGILTGHGLVRPVARLRPFAVLS